jgi:hypothetical protein
MDFGQASVVTDLVPKIAAYTVEKIRDLIKLDSLDKKRTVPIYRVRENGVTPLCVRDSSNIV